MTGYERVSVLLDHVPLSGPATKRYVNSRVADSVLWAVANCYNIPIDLLHPLLSFNQDCCLTEMTCPIQNCPLRSCQANALTAVLARSACRTLREARSGSGQCSDSSAAGRMPPWCCCLKLHALGFWRSLSRCRPDQDTLTGIDRIL